MNSPINNRNGVKNNDVRKKLDELNEVKNKMTYDTQDSPNARNPIALNNQREKLLQINKNRTKNESSSKLEN